MGPLELDYDRYAVFVDGKSAQLRPKEFELLAYFMKREGHVLTRSTLSQEIWKTNHLPTSRTIDSHIDHLRKKLGPYGEWIKPLKGVGYRFEAEDL